MEQQDLDRVGTQWLAAMRRGDFAQAWRETDRIELQRRARQASGALVWEPHHLLWNGRPFDDSDVLVRCNHGLGDTLQFIRYMPRVRRLARNLIVLVQPPLVDLLACRPELGDIRNGWTDEPSPAYDVEIEIMELPYAFRSTLSTLPRQTPYLSPPPREKREPWLSSLVGDALRVGLLWASSEWDSSRSIPLQLLEPVARRAHTRFYSLQQGKDAEAWRHASFEIYPLSRYTSQLTVLAAAMQELDLIITVDNMVAHLAGALARPVWVLLQHRADWRWMEERADSPWYPTMRLFRQPRPGDWNFVVETVAKALCEFER